MNITPKETPLTYAIGIDYATATERELQYRQLSARLEVERAAWERATAASIENETKLREEVERLRNLRTKEVDLEMDSLARERDELLAEVERLKAACEKEFKSVQQLNEEVERLKAENNAVRAAIRETHHIGHTDYPGDEAPLLDVVANFIRQCIDQHESKLSEVRSERDELRKDLCDIAEGLGVGVPDRAEAKKRILALRPDKTRMDWIRANPWRAIDAIEAAGFVSADWAEKVNTLIDDAVKGTKRTNQNQ